MGIEVRGMAQVRAAMAKLRLASKVPTLAIVGMPQLAEDKIKWLVEGRAGIQAPRDLLQLTPGLAYDMVKALAKGLAKAVFRGSVEAAWRAAGEVYLKAIQDRIGFSGGDLNSKLAPLKESTIAAKGGNTRLFYHTGALLRAIMAARIKVTFHSK